MAKIKIFNLSNGNADVFVYYNNPNEEERSSNPLAYTKFSVATDNRERCYPINYSAVTIVAVIDLQILTLNKRVLGGKSICGRDVKRNIAEWADNDDPDAVNIKAVEMMD